MRYYSTQRPVMPGSFPKPDYAEILEIHNFDHRKYVEEISREAWGWIEYNKPLTNFDMNSHELVALPEKELHLKYFGRDSWSRYVYEDENGKLWKLTDCCSPREACEERGDRPVSACGNAFDGEPDCPMGTQYKVVFENGGADNDFPEA